MLIPLIGSDETMLHVCDGKKEKDMSLKMYVHDINSHIIMDYHNPLESTIRLIYCPFCSVKLSEDYD